MKPQRQRIEGPEGDCVSACIASILEIKIDEVPNFAAMSREILPSGYSTWYLEMQAFLSRRGFAWVEMQLGPSTPMFPMPYVLTCVMIGKTKAGVRHAVVGTVENTNMDMIWNPSTISDIDAVDALCFLVPLNPASMKHEGASLIIS